MKNDEVNRRQPNLRPLAQRLPRPGRVSVFAENDDLLLLEPIRRVTYCRTGIPPIYPLPLHHLTAEQLERNCAHRLLNIVDQCVKMI